MKAEMNHVRIPSTLRKYFQQRNRFELGAQAWTTETLKNVLRHNDTADISLMDIPAFDLKDGRESTTQKLAIFGRLRASNNLHRTKTAEFDTAGAGDDQHYTTLSLNDDQRDDLVKALSRSFINQRVQHRMIMMPDVRDKDLVELLICVLHRGSTDCVANHMFRFTRFSLHTGLQWIARITVRSWMLKDIENNETPEGEDGFRGSEGNPIYIPGGSKREQALTRLKRSEEGQENSVKNGQAKAKSKQVVLNVSSIVISTTAFGDFSKMTIVSEILSASKLRYAGNEAQKLWRVFVHQPQTARCLVFLLLLGLLCQEIAQQYNDAANHFASILSLDSNLDATQYAKCHDSVETLGLVLWCLESLHKLSNSLEDTTKAIQQARKDLVAQITEDRANGAKL
ncbi:hypothetical protein F5883DRAFT_595571 [Diaporthe sp. PMI_573]|nr:hypothetical protein F5883DRAFT_595571 [Diaporthaceae sp. PMI_573]